MVLGDPVTGNEFFDRSNEQARLFSALRDFKDGKKKNIAVIGLRKIGKTSLLKEFMRKTHEKRNKEILGIEIYLPERNVNGFFRNCMSSIIMTLFDLMDFKPEEKMSLTLPEAINIIEPKFPKINKSIHNLLDYLNKNNTEEAFNYLFTLFSVLQKESKKLLIIFFDEFQRLKEYEKSIISPVDTFRENIMNQKEILYIISGSAVGMLNKLISSSNSPLYGHFEKMMLKGFDYRDAYSFIIHRKPDNLSLGDELISFLYEITNGNPYYLDVLVDSIKTKCMLDKKSCVSQDIIRDVLEGQTFSSDGRIYSHFNELMEQSLEKSGSKYYTEIIKAIAFGNNRPSQISKKTGISITTLPQYLKKLQDLEIIQKSNLNKKNSRVAEYEFIDILFEMWIKQVYSLREDPFLKGIELKMQLFKKNISKLINDYNSELGRGNEARIRELFNSFDDINIMGINIPKFDSVERKVIEGEEYDIFCRISKDVWIAEVSKSNINKTEIENIKRKIDKLIEAKEKIKKVIVIPTKEINDEAMELCGKYNFDVWNLEIINKLMKRAGMFRILI